MWVATDETLIGIAILGVGLIIFSLVIIHPLHEKFVDHLGRSLVGVGVGLVAVSTAFLLYSQRLASDAEIDRLVAAQTFRRATLHFGAVAFHLRATRRYCGLDAQDPDRAKPGDKDYFDAGECRKVSKFANETAKLLPGSESVFAQVAKASKAIPKANYIAVFVTDSELALRTRVGVIIDASIINDYLNSGRYRGSPGLLKTFSNDARRLQLGAEATAAVFCVLADRLGRSWREFDEAIRELDNGLEQEVPISGEAAKRAEPKVYPYAVLSLATRTVFHRAANCTDVRDEMLKLLPAAGGGDGGGNGG